MLSSSGVEVVMWQVLVRSRWIMTGAALALALVACKNGSGGGGY